MSNIVIVGVGGQGTLLASRILGYVATAQGFDVKVSEVHGMSQRGGSVVTYVKYGEKINSPIVSNGDADILLAFEQLEAYRSLSYLKKGGKLIISDLYYKDPDPMKMKAVKMESQRLAMKPRKEGDCEANPTRFVDFRVKGAFFEKPLIAQLKEIGYKILAFEDRSIDLDNYAAQVIMDGGKLEDLCCDADFTDKKNKLGYFLLVAQKPE